MDTGDSGLEKCSKDFLREVFAECKKASTICLSIVFAVCSCVGTSLNLNGTICPFEFGLLSLAAFVVVVSVASLFYIILIASLFLIMDRMRMVIGETNGEPVSTSLQKRVTHSLILFLIIIFCWSPYIYCAWPGNVHGDFLYQIMQYKGSMPLTNHHPILITLVYGFFYSIGESIGGGSAGVAAVVIAQVVFLAGTVVYSLMKISRWNRSAVVFAFVFFAFNPLLPLYATFCVKDVPSMIVISLFLLSLGDLLLTNQANREIRLAQWAQVFLFALLASLLRNSNVFLVVPSLMLLFIVVQKRYRIAVASVLLGVIVPFGVWSYAIVPTLGAESGSIREALSVPLQQTAAYCKQYPDELSDEEAEAIQKLLPAGSNLEQLGSRYTYKISDPVKGYIRFQSSGDLTKYMKAWASMGIKHPELYATVFLHGNYGYWYPYLKASDVKWGNTFSIMPHDYLDSLIKSGFKVECGAESLQEISTRSELAYLAARKSVDCIWEIPPFSFLVRPAWYFFIAFTMCVWAYTRNRQLGAAFLPFIVLFFVCLASPDYSNMRYVMPIVFCLPLLLSLCVANESVNPIGKCQQVE